jgi:hypothetical protein
MDPPVPRNAGRSSRYGIALTAASTPIDLDALSGWNLIELSNEHSATQAELELTSTR